MVFDNWQLPIRVDWIDDSYGGVKIGPGIISLLPKQQSVLTKVIDKISNDFHNGRYWVLKRELELIAFKVPDNSDPLDYIKWIPEPIEGRVDRRRIGRKSITDFCKNMAESGIIINGKLITPVVAETLWSIFMDQALRWMLLNNKPLDMLFAKLYALPYRNNWKEINHVESKISKTVLSSRVVTASRKGAAAWTLEIVPGYFFRRAIRMMNRDIISKIGNEGYLFHLKNAINKILPYANEIYHIYSLQANLPHMEIPGAELEGSNKEPRKTNSGEVYKVEYLPDYIGFGPKTKRIRLSLYLEKKAERMLSVPFFRQAKEKLRRRRANVLQPFFRRTNPDRLSLLDALQNPDKARELLGIRKDGAGK